MGTIYTYARVSSDKQDTDTQEKDLIKRYPDAVAIVETASGIKHRPELTALVARLQSTDTLVVSAIDRLGRRTSEILNLIEDLTRRGVAVVSLRENVDYSTPIGRLVTQVLASVAEMERSLISIRTKDALRVKKAAGMRLGPPVKYSPEIISQVRKMHKSGITYGEINKKLGISVGRISQILSPKKSAVV